MADDQLPSGQEAQLALAKVPNTAEMSIAPNAKTGTFFVRFGLRKRKFVVASTVLMGSTLWLWILWLDREAIQNAWLLIPFAGGVAYVWAFVVSLMMWKYSASRRRKAANALKLRPDIDYDA